MTKDAESEFIGSSGIAALLGNSRTGAWRLMKSGAFGELYDFAPEGALRSQLRARRANVLSWIDSRRLSA